MYIVLSGTVLVQPPPPPRGSAAAAWEPWEVDAGDSLGVDELLHEHTEHTLHAHSQDAVELMEISLEDFNSILRSPLAAERDKLLAMVDTLPFSGPLNRSERLGLVRRCRLHSQPGHDHKRPSPSLLFLSCCHTLFELGPRLPRWVGVW